MIFLQFYFEKTENVLQPMTSLNLRLKPKSSLKRSLEISAITGERSRKNAKIISNGLRVFLCHLFAKPWG
jgi:hypothetical protein